MSPTYTNMGEVRRVAQGLHRSHRKNGTALSDHGFHPKQVQADFTSAGQQILARPALIKIQSFRIACISLIPGTAQPGNGKKAVQAMMQPQHRVIVGGNQPYGEESVSHSSND